MGQKEAFECYVQFIQYYKANPPEEGEFHHAIPSSISKLEERHEITKLLEEWFHHGETVLLPYRQHYVSHKLVIDVYPRGSDEWCAMKTALHFMSNGLRKAHYEIMADEYEEVRKGFVESRTGPLHPLYGTKHTDEENEKNRQANLGEKNGFFGHVHDKETRKRMSDSAKEVAKRPEVIEIRRNLLLGKTPDPARVKKAADKNRGKKRSKRQRAEFTIAQNREEVREAKSVSMQRKNAGKKRSKQTKKKLSIAQKNPETNKRRGKGIRLSSALRRAAKRFEVQLGMKFDTIHATYRDNW